MRRCCLPHLCEGLQGVKELDAAHGEGTAMWTPLDVTKQEDWISAIKSIEAKFGPLDVCVLNAGYISPTVGQTKSLDQIDMAEFRKITEINEMGTILGLKYAAESMKRLARIRGVSVRSCD